MSLEEMAKLISAQTEKQERGSESQQEGSRLELPSISTWDEPEKLGVAQGCWEPYGSRQHAEPPVEPTVVDVPPPIRTGEYLPAGFIKMFQKGDSHD